GGDANHEPDCAAAGRIHTAYSQTDHMGNFTNRMGSISPVTVGARVSVCFEAAVLRRLRQDRPSRPIATGPCAGLPARIGDSRGEGSAGISCTWTRAIFAAFLNLREK